MPSLAYTSAMSLIEPMFAYSRIFCPSFVTGFMPFSFCRSFFCVSDFCFFSCICIIVSMSGSIYTSPLKPSTIISAPLYLAFVIPLAPITAGMFIVLARIEVWELELPFSVTKARIFDLSSCTVSEGARSSAPTITGTSDLIPVSSALASIEISLSDISLTSAALACM